VSLEGGYPSESAGHEGRGFPVRYELREQGKLERSAVKLIRRVWFLGFESLADGKYSGAGRHKYTSA